jgi:hypothetical protein
MGVESGMFAGLPRKDVFHANGLPVFSGAFGVEKVKRGVSCQRFIANLGINEYSARFSSGASTLPHPSQLTLVLLDDGETLVVDEDDESTCFYNYKLPQQWERYFAFSLAVPAEIFGGPEGEMWHPALSVIPMGWISSCDVLQDIARHLVTTEAGLGAECEFTPMGLVPDLRAPEGAWQNYIDNFYHFRVLDASSSEIGQPSASTVQVRKVKDRHGIPLDNGKRKNGATQSLVLGAEVSGPQVSLELPEKSGRSQV